MSAPIGPGDWVEYIGADPMPKGRGPYCIEAAVEAGPSARCGDTGPGFFLAGVARDPFGWSHCACELRPIDRRTTELFRSLLTPAPEVVNEGVLEEVGP